MTFTFLQVKPLPEKVKEVSKVDYEEQAQFLMNLSQDLSGRNWMY